MVEHASVVRISYFHPADGKRDEVIGALRQVGDLARGFEGSFGAQTATADDRPEAVVVISRWRTGADMNAFFAAHGQQINDLMSPFTSGPPESRLYTSLSD